MPVNVIICDDETCLDAVCCSPRALDGALVTSFDASGFGGRHLHGEERHQSAVTGNWAMWRLVAP